jgi:transcriptional regulator with XRE-family HTH domain
LERGLSRERSGELSGLRRNHVGAIERAERTPGIANADKIARALGTTLSHSLEPEQGSNAPEEG